MRDRFLAGDGTHVGIVNDDLFKIAKRPWEMAFSTEHVLEAFRVTGISPFTECVYHDVLRKEGGMSERAAVAREAGALKPSFTPMHVGYVVASAAAGAVDDSSAGVGSADQPSSAGGGGGGDGVRLTAIAELMEALTVMQGGDSPSKLSPRKRQVVEAARAVVDLPSVQPPAKRRKVAKFNASVWQDYGAATSDEAWHLFAEQERKCEEAAKNKEDKQKQKEDKETRRRQGDYELVPLLEGRITAGERANNFTVAEVDCLLRAAGKVPNGKRQDKVAALVAARPGLDGVGTASRARRRPAARAADMDDSDVDSGDDDLAGQHDASDMSDEPSEADSSEYEPAVRRMVPHGEIMCPFWPDCINHKRGTCDYMHDAPQDGQRRGAVQRRYRPRQ